MEKSVKPVLVSGVLAGFLLTGCLVGHGPHGSAAVVVVPPLPSVVVLEAEPYYQQSGYFYYYQGDRWSYAKSKSGPWMDLPPGHYPKEVKHKNQGDSGKGKKHGHDKD